MTPDASIWNAYGYIFTANGWKYVTQFKFETVPASDVALAGLVTAQTYIRLCGILYKDTDFDGVADDTAGIIRDGGFILDASTWIALASAINASYTSGTGHADETFNGDDFASLAYLGAFFGEAKRSDTTHFSIKAPANMILMPAGAWIEYYDFMKDGEAYVHFCTDKFMDTNFDGEIGSRFGGGDTSPVLEHACGIMIPLDYGGVRGAYALAFATAIQAYLSSLGPT